MKKALACLLVLLMVVSITAGCGGKSAPPPKETPKKVMMYSSMKDSQLAELKAGFIKKYPNIEMDYYTAGTGSVMTKLATEQQAGGINADIVWVGDSTNYLEFKEKGLLMPYDSPEAKNIPDQFKDKDNMFIGARVVMLGFIYNTDLVKENDIPKTWNDLLKPRYKNQLGITDPTFSGTTFYTVGGLLQHPDYGWKYFEGLKNNGILLEKGSSSVVTKVGSGDYQVSIGVDYIARTLIEQGSKINFVLPEDSIPIISSPIGIIKDTKNVEAAKLLYDYILSEEGQNILMKEFTAPVRAGMQLKGAMPVQEAAKKALPIDEIKLVKERLNILTDFDKMFK